MVLQPQSVKGEHYGLNPLALMLPI